MAKTIQSWASGNLLCRWGNQTNKSQMPLWEEYFKGAGNPERIQKRGTSLRPGSHRLPAGDIWAAPCRSIRVQQEEKEEEEERQANRRMTNGARTRNSRDKFRAQTENWLLSRRKSTICTEIRQNIYGCIQDERWDRKLRKFKMIHASWSSQRRYIIVVHEQEVGNETGWA